MFGFPALPGWSGLHPAIVHFPVALLLATPLLVLASFFARGAWRSWACAACLTLAVGTFATWFAVASGHDAGQLVDKDPRLAAAILRHEALGIATRNVFTVALALWALLVALPGAARRPWPAWLRIGAHALFLAGYVAAAGLLARTANDGGRLVHVDGLRAFVNGPPAAATAVVAADEVPAAPVRRR